jgi:23S rRNA (cytosine1962-C5)-methyltransferase
MDDQWWISYRQLSLRLGLTSFKHVGVFPEQAPNWEFIYRKCKSMEKPQVLNLFAYTGAASLAAKAAGAEVTHLDSVRQVVTWARGNMERSGLDGIRWVVEDAMKFASRELRRGHRYDGIILDPPAYGHGPDGEKWKLDECLFGMLRTVAGILAPGGFVVLNLYSNGYSAALGETLVREAFGIHSEAANITSGELALKDKFGKVLPLSIVVRLENA